MGIKSLLKKILLPQPQLVWEPGYDSWRDALEASRGYDDETVLQATLAAAREVVAGRAAYDRDGVLFGEIQYSWPLLASLLYVSQRCGSLRVIDVGGALGSSYRQNRGILASGPSFHWSVVEQETIVEYGINEFASDDLSFYPGFPAAAAAGGDVVFFGASLCYLEEPFAYLEMVENAQTRFLIIDRTPFITAPEHEVTLQHVHLGGYDASYPCWRFSMEAFENRMHARWKVVLRWVCELQPDSGAVHYGYLLERLP